MSSAVIQLFVLLVLPIVVIVPFFQIWKRTGHSGWASILMIVPVLNLIMLYVLAFKEWPALRKPEVSPR